MKKNFALENYFKDVRCEKFNEFLASLSGNDLDIIQDIYTILKHYKMDVDSYFACAFFIGNHNLTEDENKFYGADVQNILKKLSQVDLQESKETDLENVRNMFICMVQDIRAMIILLAYNLYLAEHIEMLESDTQVQFARMVRDVYAPLSARLGLREIKNKMEDFVFQYFEPEMFKQLSLDDRLNKVERLRQINIAIDKIKSGLTELKIKGEVYGREKHLASVYKKLVDKRTTLSQIYDLMAVRVIVNTVEECYLVLGKINSMFTILPDRFKDYIATPKPNGYKSIHTGILSENNRPIEVQIRTVEMHHFNEYGIAAHWIYKEKGHKKSSMDDSIGWLKQIIDENKDLSNKEFVETLSRDMFSSEIFAQTPNGKIIKFPTGANCIDFAYAIHSDVGNRCVGAKINGKMVPIVTELQNGDVCEIITGPITKGPSRDWLNLVKTAGARSKINSYFKKQFVDENIRNGRTAIDSYAKNMGYSIADVSSSEKLPEFLRRYYLNSIDELYSLVGNGNIKAENVVNRLINKNKNNATIKTITKSNGKKQGNTILVGEHKDILTRYAKCCMPVAKDPIVGFMSIGRGITIHRADCPNIKYLDKSRFIPVEWDTNAQDDFQVRLKVVFSEKASVSQVALVLEKLNIKVVGLELNPYDEKEITMSVIVQGIGQIDVISNKIKSINSVRSCSRI